MNSGGLLWARRIIPDPAGMIVKNFAFLVLAWVVAAQAVANRMSRDDAPDTLGSGSIRHPGGPKESSSAGCMRIRRSKDAASFPARRIFCIASAGCTAMALATRHRGHRRRHQSGAAPYAEAARRRRPEAASVPPSASSASAAGASAFGWRRRTLASFLALEHPVDQMAFWNRHLNSAAFGWPVETLLSVASAALRLCLAFPRSPAASFWSRASRRVSNAVGRHTPTGQIRMLTRCSLGDRSSDDARPAVKRSVSSCADAA